MKLNQILSDGKIVDNKRVKSYTMKDVLNTIAVDSEGFKCAVGYFYIEGLIEIINSLKYHKEIKILMGYQTSKPTKNELIKVFNDKFNQLDVNEKTKPAIKLFYQLVKEYKNLKIRVYFGFDEKPERLHSKAYLFLRNIESEDYLERYKTAIIGSSNLTPSGLVGNTELNTIITEHRDLNALELWFDDLWDHGTENFENLIVSDALIKAIEKSKFKDEIKSTFLYIEPRDFFKILIKFLNADYLFEQFEDSNLFKFQHVDFIRALDNFNGKGYRGCFLTSSVGLGKSYVASQIAKYFIHNGEKVLLIAPSGLVKNQEQWPRYLKEFGIEDNVNLIGMGLLQKKPEEFDLNDYIHNYGLIIVDEAHNYRNPDSYRNRNLRKIIDENGNSKVLFLTATPINTRFDDLLNLINLFYREGQSLLFDELVRKLKELINLLKTKEYEELTEKEKNDFIIVQEQIEKEIFVKSTGATIKTSENYIEELKSIYGVDIREINDPDVSEIRYELDSRYDDIIEGIVDFITSLSIAHLKILDPEKGIRLTGIFKWILYKRFESDISSYYLTLERLYKRNSLIIKAVSECDIKCLNRNLNELDDDAEYEDDIEIKFQMNFREKLSNVIDKIANGNGLKELEILEELKNDTELIKLEIDKIRPLLKENSNILFKNDQKLNRLNYSINDNPNKNFLIFTQYADTLKAINEYFKDIYTPEEIRFVTGDTKNKQSLIEKLNDPEDRLRILVSTDTLSEGFNISGADIVINFDIPYNPVRIIQRIGRATRLDNPKHIKVLNFRPADRIDIELKLVSTMELRIKDIIRFIGVEYRIWFETEKKLLAERRNRDKKIYFEILERIRGNLREGNFEDLEIPISYSKPILIFLQKAIKNYELKKEEVNSVDMPTGNNYTLLSGKKDTSIVFNNIDSFKDINFFNEEILIDKNFEEINSSINFETVYEEELDALKVYKDELKSEKRRLEYFNDNLDQLVNNILDYIVENNLLELHLNISNLQDNLNLVRTKCGSTTERVLKNIKREINTNISRDLIDNWIRDLQDSFTKRDIQKRLITKQESLFAIGFLEE